MGKSGRIWSQVGFVVWMSQIRQNHEIREFITNLSWSFFGGVASYGLLLLSNVLAGRWMGPEGYGKFSVVFTAAQALLVCMLLGTDLSVTRKLARDSEEYVNDKKTISNSSFLVFCGVVLVGVIFVMGIFILQFKLDAVEKELAFFSVILAAVLAGRQLLDAVARGKKKFKQQAAFRFIESITIISLFILFFWKFGFKGYQGYVLALGGGALVLIVLYILFLVQKIRPPEKEGILELLRFGKIAFVATLLGTIFGTLDKFAIAHYLSFQDLGLYTAYFTVSVMLVSQIGALFDNVFFPTISKMKDNLHHVTRMVDYFSVSLFFPTVGVISGVVFVGVHFFGQSFKIVPAYIIGFSVVAALRFILIVNTSLITAHSERSLKIGVVYGNAINLIFIFVFLAFVNHSVLSIQVMIYFLMIYTGVFIALNKWILYRIGMYKKIVC